MATSTDPRSLSPDPRVNRDEAVARVEANAVEEWKEVVHRAIRWVAQHHRLLTSDDVWEAMEKHYPDTVTHEHRAIGPAISKAVREGLIRLRSCEHCGTKKVMTASRRPQANCSDTPIYESLIYGQRDKK